jgi:hypothetical protein
VTAEVVRVGMNIAELFIIIAGSFVAGCVAGWWIRGR